MNLQKSEMPKLYAVAEFSDLFVDAVVRDGAGELLFMSIFGRDAMLLQMLAAFTLPVTQGGRNSITLIDADVGQKDKVMISRADQLEKLSGKLQTDVFGEVGHVWLYDPLAIQFDRSNRRALLLRFSESEAQFAQRCWATIQVLSPVALLDHWFDPLISALGDRLIQRLAESSAPPIGVVDGVRIELGDDFETIISMSVANGALTLNEDTQPFDCVDRIRQAVESVRQRPPVVHEGAGCELETTPVQRMDLFPLGQIVATSGVSDLVHAGIIRPAALLKRHRQGDWGNISKEDAHSNSAAVSTGFRILSAYPIDPSKPCAGFGDNTVWIITEADRSVTTLLLPSEY